MAPHIEAVTATSNIIFLPLKDIAPFAVLPKNAWDVKGIDFSLPCDERKTYEARRELELEAAGIQQPGVGSAMTLLRCRRLRRYCS
jgi:hypothetical protein